MVGLPEHRQLGQAFSLLLEAPGSILEPSALLLFLELAADCWVKFVDLSLHGQDLRGLTTTPLESETRGDGNARRAFEDATTS